MQIWQQPGYVLHVRPWRETSLLLECLTPELGRVGLVARGVRGRKARIQRATLEAFQPVNLSFQLRGEMGTLREAEAGLRHELMGTGLFSGLYLNELVVRLTVRLDAHVALFAAYADTLVRLATHTGMAWSLRRFERDLLQALGYAPVLDIEPASGCPIQPLQRYDYAPELGPVVRPQTGWIPGSALLALATDREPGAEDLRVLKRLMRHLIAEHLGDHDLASWRFFSHRRGVTRRSVKPGG